VTAASAKSAANGVLDGEWRLRRTSGLLPPLGAMRKLIDGTCGWTLLGSVSMPFDVVGNELHYRFPLTGMVDVLTPDGRDSAAGRATLFGRQYGTFRMERVARPSSG
jgi:hypothetical protein